MKHAFAVVNQLVGDIPKVTPSSKMVGDFANFIVQNNLLEMEEDFDTMVDKTRAKVLAAAEKLDFPLSVVTYFQGHLGQPLGGFPQDLQGAILKGLPTYFYGMQQGQEILVDLEPGKTLVIRLDAVSKPNDKGQRTVFFELNGQGRQITVQDTSLADEVVTAPKADTANDRHVGAPMPGTVIGVHCAAGDSVDAGDPLLTLEAMKMETVIRAPHAGTVEEVLPPLKSTVQAEDLLVVMA